MSAASSFILAAAQVLAPTRDAISVVEAIADRVEIEQPLFVGDESRLKTSALLVSVAWREGSLGGHVEGDHIDGKPTSFCTMQVNLSPGARTREGWTGPELRDDPAKCVAVGFRMLRESIHVDPKNPVSFYARGPRWQTAEARRISRDRMALAMRLVRDVAATKRTYTLFFGLESEHPHRAVLSQGPIGDAIALHRSMGDAR